MRLSNARCALLGSALTMAFGCSNALGYDDISFDQGTEQTGATSGDGGRAGGAGGSQKGGTGGANAAGGASGSATGGSSGSSAGGSGATGASSSGGSAGSLGSAGSSGMTGSGGALGTGGKSGTGGTTGSAGAGTGGASGTGGKSGTGGMTGSGGSNGTGGANGTGGTTGTGGKSGTGGTTGTGGTSGTGGTAGTGGAPPTGHTETRTDPSGTGSEPGGIIPVCCVPSATEKTRIQQHFNLLNQHRAANGRSALAYDTKLEAAVEGHCHHMATHTFFAHDAPEAPVMSPWTRATLCGANASGENIYYGSTDPQAAINAFITSPGHNANMLGTFTRVGVGNYGTRWGQLFGR